MSVTPPLIRCAWVPLHIPEYVRYHDHEWGVPIHTDRRMFEFIVLESAQAGLSWLTILRKRAGYKQSFADFDPERVARFTGRDVTRLMRHPRIVRNKMKIEGTITNARAFLRVRQEWGTFSKYLWSFVDGVPIQPHRRAGQPLPAVTPLAVQIAADLRRRGFRWLGPTVVYAHLQATGIVNDHIRTCWRYGALGGEKKK